MDRVTEAFAWPARDPQWVSKVVVIGLILLIPVVGAINGVGWMLAALERVRAGRDGLPPANLRYIGRGFRLFVVAFIYGLAIALIAGLVYLPAVLIFINEGRGSANAAAVSGGVLLSLLSFSLATLGSLALNFAMPSIVLATERGGIAGGLRVLEVVRAVRASLAASLVAGLMLIAASFIGSVGIVACGVGVLFSTGYSLAMQAWIVHCFEQGSSPAKAA
ncbi:MAG TPA: DUF4013 domain-containing protein [Candidatus Dormibacteraeota bacterium]|nr:DUF4013 domain-containing protein [Candidatus Dormibacteraeota bacterium]